MRASGGLGRATLPVVAFRSGTVLVDPCFERVVRGARILDRSPKRRATTLRSSAAARPASPPPCMAPPRASRRSWIDRLPGGQAGTSSRIRNYLGFPNGLSGRDLTNRALEQAWFFGARFVLSRRPSRSSPSGRRACLRGSTAPGRSRRSPSCRDRCDVAPLDVPRSTPCSALGVFYGAAAFGRRGRRRGALFVVGAGNSAGQAAVHLARAAASVTLLVRGERLGASMSDYLVRAARRDAGRSRSGSAPRSSTSAAGPA